jgi:ABC-2 type transport system ATP-binding protein
MVNEAAVIEADGLVKRYGTTTALNGVSFSVARGTIVGLLGPNGSGKSTAVRALTTLLTPDEGTGRINGIDVVKDPELARFQFGLAGQSASVDEMLSGRRNLILIGQLYQMPKQVAQARAEDLLASFDLLDAADRLVKTYSGGMRRRLDLAASLVATPSVLFLDEPTSGLDPRSRRAIWEAIARLVKEGTTLLLTTQYLEEADFLADRIVVLNHGNVIANDTPRALKRSVGSEQINLTVQLESDLPVAQEILFRATRTAPTVNPDTLQLSVPAPNGGPTLAEVMTGISQRQIAVEDISLRRPTLDEVFLQLTGLTTADASAPFALTEKEVA